MEWIQYITFNKKEGKLYYEDKKRGSFYIYEIGFLFGKEI